MPATRRAPDRAPPAPAALAGVLAGALAGALAVPAASAGEGACADPGPLAPLPGVALVTAGEGFRDPVLLLGDGAGATFVVEQRGTVRRLDAARRRPGRLLLDLRDRVIAGGERGLLGLAFHPDYPRDPRLFADYTTTDEPALGRLATRVSEIPVDPASGTAQPARERVLLAFAQPWGNHNGGMIAFGPDRRLYVATGDGGAGNDPHDNGQRLDTLLGKILRLDVDVPGRARVPPDNPFVGRPGARGEIFAYGLRNPWRFSFDRATGRLYAGDVGQNAREEIDLVRAGGNYGWRVMEGTICTPAFGSACDRAGLEPPLLDYGHGLGYSVTGGYVYRGRAVPALCGVYVYGDYGSGTVWGLRHDGRRVTRRGVLARTSLAIASFGEDEAGELFVVDHGGTVLGIAAGR